MFFQDCENVLIANNSIYQSNKSGINYGLADEVDIEYNEIFACTDYGIFLNSSSLYINVIYNSIGWGGINARDDGSNNDWDTNYWDDFVSNPYLIYGAASSSDSNAGLFEDTTAPAISDESNILYYETQIGNHINWTFSDDHPILWALEIDEVEVDSGWWCGCINHYDLDVDGLSLGTYNYTFIVQDAPGTNSSDEVIVTVEP